MVYSRYQFAAAITEMARIYQFTVVHPLVPKSPVFMYKSAKIEL